MAEEKGCEACRSKVYSGELLPLLATDVQNHIRLRQCDVCGAFWLYAERYYQVIAKEEATKLFGNEWNQAGGK